MVHAEDARGDDECGGESPVPRGLAKVEEEESAGEPFFADSGGDAESAEPEEFSRVSGNEIVKFAECLADGRAGFWFAKGEEGSDESDEKSHGAGERADFAGEEAHPSEWRGGPE